MLTYDPGFTFSQNLEDLKGHLEGKVAELEGTRERIDSGPNHPDLKAVELAAVDQKLQPARLRFEAAKKGKVYHDPRDHETCSATHQTWVAKALERGKLVGPENFEPSKHASREIPLKVERGNPDKLSNLGAGTSSDITKAGSRRPYNTAAGYTGL